MLKELFKYLPILCDKYVVEVLTTPLRLSRPVSPYTAGFIGSKIGGLAVGIAAAQDAINKEQKYQENVKEIINSKINIGNAYDKVENCFLSIEAIINTKESTKKAWESEKNAIYSQMNDQYKIHISLIDCL